MLLQNLHVFLEFLKSNSSFLEMEKSLGSNDNIKGRENTWKNHSGTFLFVRLGNLWTALKNPWKGSQSQNSWREQRKLLKFLESAQIFLEVF